MSDEKRVVAWHDGVPVCTEDECPQFDGKRCREMGFKPDRMCEPEVRDRLASLPRQGEGDVVERVLAVECPTCGTELGTPCDDFGGDRHVFCASRLRASTPTPAPTDVARAALERIAAEKCAYDGSYDSCAEAEEDGDFTGTCAVCIARAALGRTPAPLLEGPRLRDDQRLNELLLDYAASWAANQASFEICQRRRHETLDAIQAHLGSAPRRPPIHNFADCIKADGDKPCADCVDYANESVGAPRRPGGGK